MRLMSFAFTTAQMEARTKDVTRRLGWTTAKSGDVVQPIEKGQGLKKGEKVRLLSCGPIRFLMVDRVRLDDISPTDVHREGFPMLTPRDFIRMFKRQHHCRRSRIVTRIQFEYVQGATE